MRWRLLPRICSLAAFALLVGAATSAAGAGPKTIPRVRWEQPPPPAAVPAEVTAPQGDTAGYTHFLAPVIVRQSYTEEGTPKVILPVNQPFTFETGGTFLKHEGRRVTVELKFQYNPHGGFDLFRLAW